VVEQSQEKWRPVFRPALRQKKLAEQSPRKVEAGFPSGFANMTKQISDLLDEVRSRFAHVDECPFTGPRVFFENAGGALTLKSAVETSAKFAAIPDNQGRDNPASHALVDVINTAKAQDAAHVQRARRAVLRRRKRHRASVPHHPHGHRWCG
jgi:hypothetical protein